MGAHEVIDRWRPLRLRLDTDAIHLFDQATGAALAPGSAHRRT